MNKQQLIEDAASNLREALGDDAQESKPLRTYVQDVETAARALLDVFEGAYTPTDDELEKLIVRLQKVIETAILDSLLVADDRAVGEADFARSLADRVEAEAVRDAVTDALRCTVQAAPTEEEREDLAHVIRNTESAGAVFASTLAGAILAAGFHRTVQGEPSDAQIEAACLAYAADEMTREEWEWLKTQPEAFQPYWDGMKAALRAAAETGGER